MKRLMITRRQQYLLFFLVLVFVIWTLLCKVSIVEFLARSIVMTILLYCIFRGLSESEFLNPYLMFALVPLSLLSYNSEISPRYLLPLNGNIWLFAIVNMISFIAALNFTSGSKLSASFIDSYSEKEYLYPKLNETNCVKHAILLMSVFAILQILSLRGITLPVYSTLILLLHPAIAFACKSRKRIVIISIYLITFLLVINSLNKTTLLFIGFTTLFCYKKYSRSKIKTWKIAILLVVLFYLLLISFNYKSYLQQGGNFQSYISGDFFTYSLADSFILNGAINWRYSKILAMPYLYFVQAWNNLQYVIVSQPEHTYGLWFIKPVLGWLTIDNHIKQLYRLRAYSVFNTYTYMTVLFKDFGLYFAWIGSAFLGWFVKRAYIRYCYSDSPLIVASYALISCATAEMFFSNHFMQQSYPFTIVLLCWLYRKVFPELNENRR